MRTSTFGHSSPDGSGQLARAGDVAEQVPIVEFVDHAANRQELAEQPLGGAEREGKGAGGQYQLHSPTGRSWWKKRHLLRRAARRAAQMIAVSPSRRGQPTSLDGGSTTPTRARRPRLGGGGRVRLTLFQ